MSRLGLGSKNPPVPLPGSRTIDGHGVAEINAAAFSSEAGKRPASVGYGQPTGTAAVGTFAFHRDRGDSYRTLERWNDARQEYEFALRQAPGDAETRALLGEMQARIGDERRALRNLAQAAKDAPSLSAVPYRKGNALRALKRNELAIGAYLDAVRLDGTNKDALNNLGVSYMETGSYDRAAQTFERLLAQDPNQANAILNLGILYEEHLDDTKKAADFYNRYLDLKGDVPRKTEVRRWLTLLNRKAGQ
jgi:tetratricopeptide (TPR) repeat protein